MDQDPKVMKKPMKQGFDNGTWQNDRNKPQGVKGGSADFSQLVDQKVKC